MQNHEKGEENLETRKKGKQQTRQNGMGVVRKLKEIKII